MAIFDDGRPNARERMNFMRDQAFRLDDELVSMDTELQHDSMVSFPDSHRRMTTALTELRERLDAFLEDHGA